MERKAALILIVNGACLVVVLGAIWVGIYRGDQSSEQLLTSRVPYPILLIHGLGGRAAGWGEVGLVDYLGQQGLHNGGVVRMERLGSMELAGEDFPAEDADFFSIDISDPYAGLELWQREIADAVDLVLAKTRASRVILVGFSAGGVAARKYLVAHSEDHRTAKLVTIASPHRGSELALVSVLGSKVREAVDAGRLPGAAVAPFQAAIAKLSDLMGIDIESPLLAELVPPKKGNALYELNRSEHPSDLDYVCVVATGSSLPLEHRSFQAEFATILRGEVAGSRIAERLVTLWMSTMALWTGNHGKGGDGAVLAGSQNLSHVAFFRRHPELVRDVLAVRSGHHGAKGRYHAVLEAIGGPVAFLGVQQVRAQDGTLELSLAFESFLAGIVRVEARDDAGRSVAIGEPRVFREGRKDYARVLIGPIPEPLPASVDVFVTVPGQAKTYGKRIGLAPRREGASRVAPPFPDGAPLEIQIEKIWGFSSRRWDRMGGAGADLVVVLFRNDEEVARSRLVKNAGDPLTLNWHLPAPQGWRTAQLRIEIWDLDFGSFPETVGRIVFQPGRLPLGFTLLIEDGVSVQLDVEPGPGDGVYWDPNVLWPE